MSCLLCRYSVLTTISCKKFKNRLTYDFVYDRMHYRTNEDGHARSSRFVISLLYAV